MPYPVAAVRGGHTATIGVNFLPSDSASLSLWLRAPTTSYNTGTTQATDTQLVSSWVDSVGSKSFAQATDANKPMYAVLETTPAIRFAGINRTNSLTYTNKIFGTTSSFTLSVAVRIPNINTLTSAIYAEANTASVNDILQITVFTSGVARCLLRDKNNVTVNADSTTRIDDNKIHIVTMHMTGGHLYTYVDGVQEADADTSTLTGWATSTMNRTALGARVSTSTLIYLQCDIFEVVGYSTALDAATLALHHAYMRSKYSSVLSSMELCGMAQGQPLYTNAFYASNKSYIGSFNFNKSPQITVIDHTASPVTKKTYAIETNIGDNYHDSVAICLSKAGRILAFYANHDTNVLYFSKETTAGDLTAWDAKADIGPGTKHSYPQCIVTTEGANSWRVYVFYRDSDHGCWNYRYSDDTDAATPTWAAAQTLWQPKGDTSVQIYGTCRMCSDGNIHFTMTSDDVEPGPAGGADLYHWMYKPSAAKWYKSDGTTEITSLPFDTTDAVKCYDAGDHGIRNPSNKQDILVSGGNIYVAVGTSDRTGATTEGRLVRLVYSGGSWTVDEAVELTPSWVFPSFSNSGQDTIYYTRQVSGVLQLFQAVLSGGVWTVTQLTSGAHFTSAGPGTMRVKDGVDLDVVWFYGDHNPDTYVYGMLFGYPAL